MKAFKFFGKFTSRANHDLGILRSWLIADGGNLDMYNLVSSWCILWAEPSYGS